MNCTNIAPPARPDPDTYPLGVNGSFHNGTGPITPFPPIPFWNGTTPNGTIVCAAYPVVISDLCCTKANGTAASLCEWTMCHISSGASYDAWWHCLDRNGRNEIVQFLGGGSMLCGDLNNNIPRLRLSGGYTFANESKVTQPRQDDGHVTSGSARRVATGFGVVALALAAIAAV